MKKTGLLTMVLAFLAAFGAHAQDTIMTGYRSFFGSESTEWYDVRWHFDHMMETHRLVVGEDTVVDGLVYKMLYEYVLNSLDTNDLTGWVDDWRHLIVREDTMTGRLWWKEDYSVDKLIVDMSLSVGDTFEDMGVVMSIHYDSLGRKIIEFPYDAYFTEGVPFRTWMFDSNNDYIVCAFQNGEKVYTNTRLDDRFDLERCKGRIPSNIGVENAEEDKITRVYPNPFHEQLFVEMDCPSRVMLFDVFGNKIEEKQAEDGIVIFYINNNVSGIFNIVVVNHMGKHIYKLIKR